MNQITIKIQDMSCGMCEAHINDTVRKVHPEAKKVASSHRKGETTFLLDGTPGQRCPSQGHRRDRIHLPVHGEHTLPKKGSVQQKMMKTARPV